MEASERQVTQPPEPTDTRTETQRLEDAIVTACASLVRDWPHMILDGETQAPGMASRSGVLLPDHDPGEADQRRIDRTLSIRRLAQDQLDGWCRVVMEDRPIRNGATLPLGTDVPAMAQFLSRHADWMSGHEAAQDCRDEVRDLARKCHQIVSPRQRESMSIGRCPLEIPGEQDVLEVCDGDVRVRLGSDDQEGWAACSKCGETAVASWWEEKMFGDPELRRWLTDRDVVTFMHSAYGQVIQQATVRQWVKRGVLNASEKTTDDGKRLFEREAVVYAIDFHKRRGA